MRHFNISITVVVIVYLLVVTLAAKMPPTEVRPRHDLNFAETVYAKLSGACRALMDLQYNSLSDQNDLIKTMKIIYLDGNDMKTYPIDAAYVALTKPANFDISKQTKIVIHGYKDNSQSAVPLALAQAYNEKKMFNVLLVDAEEMINKWYILSVHNARLVGKRLANLLANLENFGANAEDFHLLGISLGAHIAGWAGKYFRQYKGHNLGRITGLDPAGPCFSYGHSDQRLDKTDANYVDVVHSNRLIQGAIEPLGHSDFYINGGGPTQPGCFMPSCSHLRAAEVYIESVRNPKSFVGVQCENWEQFKKNQCVDKDYAVLGYGSSSATRGLYYLRTSSHSPFGLGIKGAKSVNSKVDPWLESLNIT
ncbi:pancreatic lipase-related protein 2-like [Ostrinia nubilalis]|uniref:pancreatic lipase-related protein 2-like n=1 Tax=Ostrinia nubilalis TaxID=29057 RepID=UPI0030826609